MVVIRCVNEIHWQQMMFIESQTMNEEEETAPEYRCPFTPRTLHKRCHCKRRHCLRSETSLPQIK